MHGRVPINYSNLNMHLSTRITKYLPKLKSLIPELEFKCTIPDVSDATANGLADIQEFHNLDLKKLAKGEISGYLTRKKMISNSKLTSKEMMKIASAAKESEYLESFIDWCHVALEAAKIEAQDEKFVKQIQETIQVNNFGYIYLITVHAPL